MPSSKSLRQSQRLHYFSTDHFLWSNGRQTTNVDIIRTMNISERVNDLSLLRRFHQRELIEVFMAAKTLMLMATDDDDSSDDDILSSLFSVDDASASYDGIDDSISPTITLYDPADEGRISDIHTVFRRDIYEGYIVPTGARYAGTVAFRCRFCKHLPSESRASQSWVFPRTIEQMYRAHIRFNREHFPNCKCIPHDIRAKVVKLKKSSCRGSKNYWVTSALKKGLVNGDKGIVLCGQAAEV